MRFFLAAVAFLSVVATMDGLPRCHADDKKAVAIKESAAAFEKARDTAQENLVGAFDTVPERLAKQKLGLEERLRLVDIVSAEKKRFQKSGLLPWSEPMRPFLAKYLEKSRAMESKVMEEYNKHISQALQAAADEVKLHAETFGPIHKLIRPQPGESRWMDVPWLTDLHEARQKAAAEGKPLFLIASGKAISIGMC